MKEDLATLIEFRLMDPLARGGWRVAVCSLFLRYTVRALLLQRPLLLRLLSLCLVVFIQHCENFNNILLIIISNRLNIVIIYSDRIYFIGANKELRGMIVIKNNNQRILIFFLRRTKFEKSIKLIRKKP